MKQKYHFLIFTIIAIYAVVESCKGRKEIGFDYKKVQSIRFEYNAGISGQFILCNITGNNCHLECKNSKGFTNIDFKLSQAEYNNIITTLSVNQFDKIETTTRKIYDNSGYSISIKYNDTNNITKSNNNQSLVIDEHKTRFNNCVNVFNKILEEYLNPKEKPIIIRFSAEFADITHSALINIGNQLSFLTDSITISSPYTIKIKHGDYRVYVDYRKRMNKQNIATFDSTIVICGNDTLFFDRIGTEIKLIKTPPCSVDER